MDTKMVADVFVSVGYMELPRPDDSMSGGAGSVRMMLSAVPEWLATRPGCMVYAIKPVYTK